MRWLRRLGGTTWHIYDRTEGDPINAPREAVEVALCGHRADLTTREVTTARTPQDADTCGSCTRILAGRGDDTAD